MNSAPASLAPALLEKKRILITGGGSGLGFAMAKKFLTLGASVGICGREKEKVNRALEELSALGQVAGTACDVRNYESVDVLYNEMTDEFGGIDILVNNAAGNFLSLSEELSPNGFKSVVDIVLTGAFNCTQQFAKRYLERGGTEGCVLNIVTTYAELGSAYVLPSACAKAGVVALTKSLAAEWGPYGIRLNAIAPGPVPTPGAWSRLVPDESFETEMKKQIPLRRFGTEEDLSNLAAYMASDLAAFMTGEVIALDGGERLNGGEFNFIGRLHSKTELRELFSKMRERR